MNRRLISLFVSVVMCGSLVAFGPAPASAIVDTCVANNFTCKVGDVGPNGGIVYYDAGSQQVWGRFLEAKTNSVPANGIWGTSALGSPDARLASKQIGYGASNSVVMSFDQFSVYSLLKDTAFRGGFFLPSKNELAAFRSTLTPIMTAKGWGGAERVWTSSQGGSGNTDAWFIGLDGYSNAQDGQEQYYPVFPIRSWAN